MFRRSGYRFADKNMRHSMESRACPDSEGTGHALVGMGEMAALVENERISLRPGLKALVDVATASHGRAAALLVALCLLTFLPGFFTMPPVDRDEARFAQATKQMIESGDYVD